MARRISAVLGGDARELRVAERLIEIGHEVRIFGLEKLPNPPVPYSASSLEAVRNAHWIIAPAPGISGDAIFAPFAEQSPILLNEELLAASNIGEGGLILGRASKTVLEVQKKMGFKVIESKDERHMAVANSTTVAEGLLRLLIEKTNRTLREYSYVVLGYGATGAAFVDVLLAMKCNVDVVTRSKIGQERAKQMGAPAHGWDERISVMAGKEIVINTVPDTGTIPISAYDRLKNCMIFDIASPPGGLNHEEDANSGLNIVWARGLGNRAPVSTGDIRFNFIQEVLRLHDK